MSDEVKNAVTRAGGGAVRPVSRVLRPHGVERRAGRDKERARIPAAEREMDRPFGHVDRIDRFSLRVIDVDLP